MNAKYIFLGTALPFVGLAWLSSHEFTAVLAGFCLVLHALSWAFFQACITVSDKAVVTANSQRSDFRRAAILAAHTAAVSSWPVEWTGPNEDDELSLARRLGRKGINPATGQYWGMEPMNTYDIVGAGTAGWNDGSGIAEWSVPVAGLYDHHDFGGGAGISDSHWEPH